MKERSKQSGMSIWGMLGILLMVGFFAMCTIRMAPPYFEFLSVRGIIEDIVLDSETDQSNTSSVRRKIDTVFNTNQILGVDSKSVDIYRKEGKMYIDASYEVRVPIFWRIDAVLRFDDLKYQVGIANPIPSDKNTK